MGYRLKDSILNLKERFRIGDQLKIAINPAFLFEDANDFLIFQKEFQASSALYYAGQPALATIVEEIKLHIDKL